MNKNWLLSIIVAGAVVIVLGIMLFHGKSFGATPKAKWQEESVMGLKSSRYTTHYWMGHCDVYTYKNGKGVYVDATDPEDNGRIVRQSITITDPPMEDGYKSPVMGEQFFVDSGGASLPPESYYDIFQRHCAQDAGLLPEDVRKSFFGFYGIK